MPKTFVSIKLSDVLCQEEHGACERADVIGATKELKCTRGRLQHLRFIRTPVDGKIGMVEERQ